MLADLLAFGHGLRVLDVPRRTTTLHTMAISAGFEQRANEIYSWDGLRRGTAPFLVIQHTLSGQGRLDYAGESHRLEPGQTMVLSLPHAHRYWLERGQRWEYFWIVLNGREALRLAHEVITNAGPVLSPSPEIIDRLASACLTLIGHPDIQPGRVSHAAYGAVTALHDAAFTDGATSTPKLPAPIARATLHIEQNLARPLNVDRIAAVTGLSRAHFVRNFTRAVGQPPSAYLLAQRIDRVERLLMATDMTIAAIAATTGFANANYLAKSFRRVHAMTPSAYRRRMRGAAGN